MNQPLIQQAKPITSPKSGGNAILQRKRACGQHTVAGGECELCQKKREEWNPEQQAEAIEDYNKLLRKSKDGTANVAELSELSTLMIYMKKVWQRQGTPHFEVSDMREAPL